MWGRAAAGPRSCGAPLHGTQHEARSHKRPAPGEHTVCIASFVAGTQTLKPKLELAAPVTENSSPRQVPFRVGMSSSIRLHAIGDKGPGLSKQGGGDGGVDWGPTRQRRSVCYASSGMPHMHVLCITRLEAQCCCPSKAGVLCALETYTRDADKQPLSNKAVHLR